MNVFYRVFTNNDQVPSLCAAAILCDDDVLVFDACGPTRVDQPLSQAQVTLYQNGVLREGFSFLELNNGWQYNIIMPSGSVVRIDLTRTLSVTVVSTARTGEVGGKGCG